MVIQKKTWLIAAILVISSLAAHAEDHGDRVAAEKPATIEVPQWVKNIRLSGYGMVQYQTTYEDEYEEDDNETSTFNLRFMRMVPVIKSKLQVKARYQTYRESKTWGSSKSLYEVGVNYFFNKNIQLNFEYARLNDRTRDKHNFNLMDVQLDFRF